MFKKCKSLSPCKGKYSCIHSIMQSFIHSFIRQVLDGSLPCAGAAVKAKDYANKRKTAGNLMKHMCKWA